MWGGSNNRGIRREGKRFFSHPLSVRPGGQTDKNSSFEVKNEQGGGGAPRVNKHFFWGQDEIVQTGLFSSCGPRGRNLRRSLGRPLAPCSPFPPRGGSGTARGVSRIGFRSGSSWKTLHTVYTHTVPGKGLKKNITDTRTRLSREMPRARRGGEPGGLNSTARTHTG